MSISEIVFMQIIVGIRDPFEISRAHDNYNFHSNNSNAAID